MKICSKFHANAVLAMRASVVIHPRQEQQMAIQYLKHGRNAEETSQYAAQVRDTVTGILSDVAKRGDEAVAELSQKFDNWSPESFRLSHDEIAACVRSLSAGQLEDIKFAQAQVRRF